MPEQEALRTLPVSGSALKEPATVEPPLATSCEEERERPKLDPLLALATVDL